MEFKTVAVLNFTLCRYVLKHPKIFALIYADN